MTKRTNFDIDNLIKLYEGGASMKQLADQFNLGRATIVSWFRKAGIPIRGRSEAESLKWSQMSAEKRAAQVKGAHIAITGSTQSEEMRRRIAQGNFRNQGSFRMGPYSKQLGALLKVPFHYEWPIGRYNVDFGLHEHSIAVEINGGGWHMHGAHLARRNKRREYIFREGYSIIEIWVREAAFDASLCADQIHSYAEIARVCPPAFGQNWMLTGTGKLAPALSSYGYDVSAVDGASRRCETSGRYLCAS